jgi:hypothetical protein
MHASVLDWVPGVLTAGEVAGRRVIEAGSYDVNGSARPYIESLGPASYTGIDIRPGPRVDMVMDAADIPARLGSAGIVASFEMLEHARDWRAAIGGMITALDPGGILLLTTRSAGFARHDHPGDWWRYSTAAMKAILEGAGLEILRLEDDPEAPGVFAKAVKPAGWAWPEDTGWLDITLETPE